MGYLTTITIHNDGLHELKQDREKFVQTIFDLMNEANDGHQEVNQGAISVQPSFHTDENQLYLHSGNCVTNINPYRQDFQELLKNNLQVAELFVRQAESLIKEAKRQIKQYKSNPNFF